MSRTRRTRSNASDLASQIPKSVTTTRSNWGFGAATPRVLLTGATGLLGSYIVHELLEGSVQAHVIAHVRAKDLAEGLARLEIAMKAYGLWSLAWTTSSRLQVMVGDISQPQAGLSENTWDCLSNEVDPAIRNGAQVNWMLPYPSLRPANVLSTLACIQLCAVGKTGRLTFVSSTSTLGNDHFM